MGGYVTQNVRCTTGMKALPNAILPINMSKPTLQWHIIFQLKLDTVKQHKFKKSIH